MSLRRTFVRRSRTPSRWFWLCGDADCHTFPHYGGNYPTASAALDAACEHIRATQPTREPTVFERAMGATG